MDKEEHILISLARPSIINYLNLHTNFYKGMAPGAIQLLGSVDQKDWVFIGSSLVTHEDLRVETIDTDKLFRYVLLILYPGGGVMRVNLMGWFTNPSTEEKHSMTLAQNERNAKYRVEQGVYMLEVDHHHMDTNGDMQEETNTLGARNLYGYIFIANELTAHGIAFNQQALLRLVVYLSHRIELRRLVAALINVASSDIMACIESYTLSLERDFDYQSPVAISEKKLSSPTPKNQL
ncbi:hypothetical protein DSO57_1020209 [Entomophthora muscae]|uniref:Uncharacterized protein n=1 Tax=Entomophthora muscae TaxID=34485 RepID=A0ACC2T484_9FUNG|nr:hypothetical protein DSO57_1020209 [Entomophthora muscae]